MAISAEAAESVARKFGNHRGLRIDAAHPEVVGIADEQVANRVRGYTHRGIELGTYGGAAIAGEAGGSVSGDGDDQPAGGARRADAVVHAVSDVEVAGAIDADSLRGIDFGADARHVVAVEPVGARADDRV